MGKRARKASAGLAQQDEQIHQEKEQEIRSSVVEVRLDQIKNRSFECTRTLQPPHVLALALSIEKMGLIEPIVVDQEYHLLAGHHRLLALRLLSLDTRGSVVEDLKKGSDKAQLTFLNHQLHCLPHLPSIDLHKVPVRVFPFLASEDIPRALQIESIENMQRQDYTLKDLFQLYIDLLNREDEESKDKFKKGPRYLKPVLTKMVGKVIRSVHKKMKEAEEGKKNKHSHPQTDS